MSIVTFTDPRISLPTRRAGSYSPLKVIRAEWTKIRSVRSTTWTLGAILLSAVAIGVLATGTEVSRWAHRSIQDTLTFDPTSLSLTGLRVGQLAIGVLGVLVMSAEYGTGTIRATFAAVPNRPLVLAAKTAVFGVVALVVAEIASFGAFFIGQAILSGTTPTATLSDPGVLRAVIGGGLYLAVLGLLALGIATIVRHTAGAITAFVGVLLILPLITVALPSSIGDAISRFLPANIGASMMAVVPGLRVGDGVPVFSPWVGFGILCGYALGAVVIGGVMLVRRDT
jgi:ABC-2 type transport system permease protein